MTHTGHPADRRGLLGAPLRPRLRQACLTLTAVTAVVIGVIVFTPGPPDASGQESLQLWIDRMHELHRLPGFITFALVEFLSNVVMFVPLGFLAAGAVRPRTRRWVIPLAVVVSVGIEVVQGAFLPDRTAAVSDVVANLIGATVGVVVLALISRWSRVTAGRPAASAPIPQPAGSAP